MRKDRFSEDQTGAPGRYPDRGVVAQARDQRRDVVHLGFEVRRDGGAYARKLRALEGENRKRKRLLAGSMLDVATLRELSEKPSDAEFPENGRDLGDRREGLFAAVCLHTDRHRAEDLPRASSRGEGTALRDRYVPSPVNGGGPAIGACTSCCGAGAPALRCLGDQRERSPATEPRNWNDGNLLSWTMGHRTFEVLGRFGPGDTSRASPPGRATAGGILCP